VFLLAARLAEAPAIRKRAQGAAAAVQPDAGLAVAVMELAFCWPQNSCAKR
jgi:hypothetical protein